MTIQQDMFINEVRGKYYDLVRMSLRTFWHWDSYTYNKVVVESIKIKDTKMFLILLSNKRLRESLTIDIFKDILLLKMDNIDGYIAELIERINFECGDQTDLSTILIECRRIKMKKIIEKIREDV